MSSVFAFEAIGTSWQIELFEELSAERQAALLRLVMDRIEAFDLCYSRFRPDSLVTEMSRRAGTFELPDDAGPLIGLYERLYRLTDGAFTPLIGQTLSDAGYDAAYSLKPKPMLPPPAWDEVIAWDGTTLTMKRPALLDFGAAGKGYLVDLVGAVLEREGTRKFSIDAGGDILYRGDVPIRIGLEDPEDATRVIGVATPPLARGGAGGSVCGSAGNRRAWGNFHHIIDPRTLASPRHILATWTFAPTALVADALATALWIRDPIGSRIHELGFEYVILYADRHVERSPGAPVELFLA